MKCKFIIKLILYYLMNTLNLIFTAIELIILLFFMGKVLAEYHKLKYKFLLYLIGAIAIIILGNLFQFLPINTTYVVAYNYFKLASVFITIIYTFMFVLFFFESFRQENILSIQNSIIIALTTGLEFALVISMYLLHNLSPTNVINSKAKLTKAEETILSISFITIILSGVMAIVILFFLIKTIIAMIRESPNKRYRNKMKIFIAGTIFIVLDPILRFIFFNIKINDFKLGGILGEIAITLGFIFMYRGIFKDSIFIFQGEGLKKLLIISPSGIPVYTYTFRNINEENQTLEEENTSEILFSGAFTSISILLSEFTGKERAVEEIKLSGMTMMIQSITKKYNVILIVDKPTTFYRTSIIKFADLIRDVIDHNELERTFNNEEIKIANQILELTMSNPK